MFLAAGDGPCALPRGRGCLRALCSPLVFSFRVVEGTGGVAGGAVSPTAGAGAQFCRVLFGVGQLPSGLAQVGRAIWRDRGPELLAFDVQVGHLPAPLLV